MHIVFISLGGHGTVLPLISLGRHLASKGHQVMLVANPFYREATAASGIEFFPICSEDEYWNGLRDKSLAFTRYRDLFTFRRTVGWNGAILKFLRAHTTSKSIVFSVDRLNLWADLVAAAHLGTTVVRLQLDLPNVKSLVSGPEMLPPTRVQQVLMVRSALEWQRVAAREDMRVGIRNVHRVRHSRRNLLRTVALWPRWITGKYYLSQQYDYYCGFVPPSDVLPYDGGLDVIQESSRGLIVFLSGSLGTTREWHSRFLSESMNICRALNVRGMLLGSDDIAPTRDLPDWFEWKPFMPLDLILPHASIIVHHGGIGTAAAAIRNSVPQVLIPRVFGQFSNAEWMRRLGVCAVIHPKSYRTAVVSQIMMTLLNDETCRTKLGALAQRCKDADPLEAFESCTARLVARESANNE